ncbi:MAG: hypothetical protein AMXMBFR7_36500 [Planctomycetota bacterium]
MDANESESVEGRRSPLSQSESRFQFRLISVLVWCVGTALGLAAMPDAPKQLIESFGTGIGTLWLAALLFILGLIAAFPAYLCEQICENLGSTEGELKIRRQRSVGKRSEFDEKRARWWGDPPPDDLKGG